MQIFQSAYDKFSYTSSLPMGNDSHYFFMLVKSSVMVQWETKLQTAPDGCLVFLRPGQKVTISPTEDGLLYDLVEFAPESWESAAMENMRLPTGQRVPPNIPELSTTMKIIHDVFYSADTYRLEKIALYCILLLYGISDGDSNNYSGSRKVQLQQKLRRLRTLVSDMPEKNWTIQEAADFAGLSISRFSCLYKECFGLSFISDVIRSRIKRSLTLLNTSDKPVEEIAAQVGYTSVKLFYRQFKSEMGFSPGEYRKMNVKAI